MSINGTDFWIAQTGEARRESQVLIQVGPPLQDRGKYYGWTCYGSRVPTQPDASLSLLFSTRSSATSSSRVSGSRLTTDMLAPLPKSSAPGQSCNLVENKAMQSRARYRHETINGCFKIRGILNHTYHHDIRRHGEVLFRAIATMTQLAISNGSSLFMLSTKTSSKIVV